MLKSKLISAVGICSVAFMANVSAAPDYLVCDFNTPGTMLNAEGFTNEVYNDASDNGNTKIHGLPLISGSHYRGLPFNGGAREFLHVEYTFGTTNPNNGNSFGSYAGVEMNLVGSGNFDATAATHITFMARAQQATNVRIMLATTNVNDYGYFRTTTTIPASTTFQPVTVDLSTFAQPSWAVQVGSLNKALAKGILIEASEDEGNPQNATNYFDIDDIGFNGMAPRPTVSFGPGGPKITLADQESIMPMVFYRNCISATPSNLVFKVDGNDINIGNAGDPLMGNSFIAPYAGNLSDPGDYWIAPLGLGTYAFTAGTHTVELECTFNNGVVSTSKTTIIVLDQL